jgi:hypothetical protein
VFFIEEKSGSVAWNESDAIEKTSPRHACDPLANNTFPPFVTKTQRFSAA